MSYSTQELLYELQGKNVLVFDTETTGLPRHCNDDKPPEHRYPDYKNNKCYDESRMIQIGYTYIENYSFNDIDIDDIHCHVINPIKFDFSMKDIKTNIHHITKDDVSVGSSLTNILKHGLGYSIKNCGYIVGYNIYFDVNILLNEINRLTDYKFKNERIYKIHKLIHDEKICCLGILSRSLDLPTWKKYDKIIYQMPSLKLVYNTLFNKEPSEQHNAGGDVISTVQIMNYLCKNK